MRRRPKNYKLLFVHPILIFQNDDAMAPLKKFFFCVIYKSRLVKLPKQPRRQIKLKSEKKQILVCGLGYKGLA